MSRRSDLEAAVKKQVAALERLLAVKKRNAQQNAALETNVRTLIRQTVELATLPPDTAPPTGTPTTPPTDAPTFEIPTDVPTGWNFQGLGEDADEGSTYLFGGSPGNPDGVDFTEGNARRWWQIVFSNRVNYSKVRPTLLPGGHVLSDEGYVAAENVVKDATSWVAPADWNPLNLPIKP